MLEVCNLMFQYKRDKTAPFILNDVSAKFQEGYFYSILGPSGSGKTTFLSILGGLEKPQSGKVLYDSISTEEIDDSELRRKYVSYIFQNYLLFPYMTAVENVRVSTDICRERHTSSKNEVIETLLSLGLSENDINRKVSKLSGGQQQRVAIARALLSPSRFLLADEPTGNLDKETAVTIIELLKKIVKDRNKGLIVVTHSELIKNMSDFTLKLDYGVLSVPQNIKV